MSNESRNISRVIKASAKLATDDLAPNRRLGEDCLAAAAAEAAAMAAQAQAKFAEEFRARWG